MAGYLPWTLVVALLSFLFALPQMDRDLEREVATNGRESPDQ